MESAEGLVKNETLHRRLARGFRWAGGMLLDLAYPPVCLNCDAPTATPNTLCSKCFKAIRPITAPLCPVLGLPFEVSLGADTLSAEAIADPPPSDGPDRH